MNIRNAIVLLAVGTLIGFGFAKHTQREAEATAAAVLKSQKPDNPETTSLPTLTQVDRQALADLANVFSNKHDFSRRNQLYQLIGSLELRELQDYAQASQALGNDTHTHRVLQTVMARLAEVAPLDGIIIAEDLTPAYSEFAIHRLFGAWSTANVEAAIDGIGQVTDLKDQRTAAQAIANSVSQQSPGDLEFVLSRLPFKIDEYEVSNKRLASLARIDPIAAANSALDSGKGISTVGGSWAGYDPESALSYALNISNVNKKRQFLRAVLSTWAKDDHDSALAVLDSINVQEKKHYSYHVLRVMVKQGHQQEALDWAKQQSGDQTGFYRGMAYSGYRTENYHVKNVLTNWTREDPYAAISFAQENGLSAHLSAIARQFFSNKPMEAANWLRGLSDQGLRMKILSESGHAIAEADPFLAVELAKEMPASGTRAQILSAAANKIAFTDPQHAMSFLDQIEPGGDRENMLASIAGQWASKDPYAVLDWIQTRTGEEQKRALQAAVASWATHHDPHAAATYYLDNQAKLKNSGASQAILNALAKSDRHAAIQWANKVDDRNVGFALREVLKQWAGEDIQAALSATNLIHDKKNKGWALNGILEQWTTRDLEAATAYLMELPDDVGGRAVTSVVSNMIRQDRQRAVQWTKSLDPGLRRDRAISTLVSQHDDGSEEMIELARTIVDNKIRQQAIMGAIGMLARKDMDRAKELLKRSDLGTSDKERMLGYFDEYY